MEKGFLKYIWTHTKYVQVWMFVVILASMPLYFLSLELPKRIVNGPIEGIGFSGPGDTRPFLRIDAPFTTDAGGSEPALFEGIELTRIESLIALSAIFLVLVLLNGWIKLYLNTFKGKTAERVLRRLRFEMFDRFLRFPVWQARKAKASEVSGIIKDEVELLADFVGESYSAPLFLSGQALTGLIFLFIQNIWFGLLTLAIVGLQFFFIPLLRRRLIELGRLRQITARTMAGSIGEVIQGIDDVHLNDTSNYARASLTHQLGKIFFIRLELFKRKFSVKFLNNLLMQFLAMLFYLVGGYFVITGRMNLGALVASIAAYKDLPGPLRGLIDWDQQRQMAQVRYTHAIEAFNRDDLAPADRQAGDSPTRIETGFETRRLDYQEPGMPALLESVSTQLGVSEAVALNSEPPGASSRLLDIFARLQAPTAGRVLLDNVDLRDVSEAMTGRMIGYADGNTFIPGGTIRNLLLEVVKNRPVAPAEDDRMSERTGEALRTGNSPHDYLAGWIDYERLGVGDDVGLLDHIRSVTLCAGLHDDICNLGMYSRLDRNSGELLASRIVTIRTRLREKLVSCGLEAFVEPFDPERYNMQSTVAENILFGMPVDPAFSADTLGRNAIVRELLERSNLRERLVALGVEIAKTFAEMSGGDSSGSALFESVTGMSPERVEQIREIIARTELADTEALDRQDEDELVSLAMNYAEPRDRFGLMDEALQEKTLEVRALLHARLEGEDDQPVIFHDFGTYDPSLTIMENVLFGRIETKLVGGRARIASAVKEVIVELDLWGQVFEAGLAYEVGASGRGLSDAQQQKLRLARALMKKPEILILNRPCAALPVREQREILESVLAGSKNTRGERPGIICAPAVPEHAHLFERVLILEHGRLVADGPPSELLAAQTAAEEPVDI